MLKDIDHPKEPLRNKAARMWKNNNVRKKIAEQKQSVKKPKNDDPEVTELIINEGRRDGRITRFENKFKRDIRSMMSEQSRANLLIDGIWQDQRHRKLLAEKLRRLKLAQQNNGG